LKCVGFPIGGGHFFLAYLFLCIVASAASK
jgi:hypothetical protein